MPTLTDFEFSILRGLSETEPRTVFQISAGLTGTEGAVEIAEALGRMAWFRLVARQNPFAPKYLRTAAGTELLAGTWSGVAVE